MKPLGNLMRHLRRVTGMARRTGVDIVEAHRDGRLDQDEWAKMVQTCRRCRWSGECRAWLNDPARSENDEAPPSQCLNRVRFGALKAEQQAETET